MDILLQRHPTKEQTTLGDMALADGWKCVTLEDAVRPSKIYGKTAISAGRYPVTITFSQKFRKKMLFVDKVPGFTGIRIHSGNDADDTLGCVLVGQVVDSPTRIHGGSLALPILYAKVEAALARGEDVWLEIHDATATV